MNKKLPLIVFFILLLSCHKNVKSVVTVYSNNFESGDLTHITNGVITSFNGSNVLGRYNNGYFNLKLDNLPKHSAITISFDLFIHDSWDGNKPAPDGPDIWQMVVDGNTFINTTFCNNTCGVNEFCTPQSYPMNYPNSFNNPKTGAYATNLPGACTATPGVSYGTTEYKITKTFTHSDATLILQCIDKLVQTNAPDPKCDESWSVDNIQIQAVTL